MNSETEAQALCDRFSAVLKDVAARRGLGAYSGGELWVYDPAGSVEVEVTSSLRGWPELKLGWAAGRWQ